MYDKSRNSILAVELLPAQFKREVFLLELQLNSGQVNVLFVPELEPA